MLSERMSLLVTDIIPLSSLPGPPLTAKSAVATLLEHNVTVALGRDIASDSRYARFDAAWVSQSHV